MRQRKNMIRLGKKFSGAQKVIEKFMDSDCCNEDRGSDKR